MRPFPEVPGVTHEFADANGLRMHYAVAGPPNGAPVVLLHGWPQHWYVWRRVIPLLVARGHRVHAPDLRGFGWTDAPRGSYEKDELASDVLALLDVLGLEKAILAGHDWGGHVGFIAALRDPERFVSYTAFAIPHLWMERKVNPRSLAYILAYQPLVAAPVLGALVQSRTRFVDLMFRAAGGTRFWSGEEVRAFSDAFREPDRAEAASRLYRHFWLREVARLAGGRYADQAMQIPCRLIVGSHDPVVTAASNPSVHGVEVEEVDAGHFIPEEQPELAADRIAPA